MFQPPFYISRTPLRHFHRAIASGTATIGFIGGSITDSRTRSRWSDVIVRELCAQYPDVSFHVVNTAIGGTDSVHAVFRAEHDLMPYRCDLIFIEYAVNDSPLPTQLRSRSREGLIRKLWRSDCDLVLAYTFERPMLEELLAEKLPASIAEFEVLAEYYHISSVFMGCYALDCLKRGLLRWEEWLPDGLHPEHCGSRYYAKPVLDLLSSSCLAEEDVGAVLPAPLSNNNLQYAQVIPFSQLHRTGYWYENHPIDVTLVHAQLSTSSIGSSLDCTFEGTGVVICTSWGTCAADYRWCIDSGPWQQTHLSRPDLPDWPGKWGWTRTNVLADQLPRGKHTLRIESWLHQDESCRGINLDICYIGVMP